MTKTAAQGNYLCFCAMYFFYFSKLLLLLFNLIPVFFLQSHQFEQIFHNLFQCVRYVTIAPHFPQNAKQ